MIAAMKRREFITLIGGATAWPLGALGQQSKKLPTIGILTIPGLPVDAFRRSLRDLGWIEGQNVLAVDAGQLSFFLDAPAR